MVGSKWWGNSKGRWRAPSGAPKRSAIKEATVQTTRNKCHAPCFSRCVVWVQPRCTNRVTSRLTLPCSANKPINPSEPAVNLAFDRISLQPHTFIRHLQSSASTPPAGVRSHSRLTASNSLVPPSPACKLGPRRDRHILPAGFARCKPYTSRYSGVRVVVGRCRRAGHSVSASHCPSGLDQPPWSLGGLHSLAPACESTSLHVLRSRGGNKRYYVVSGT